MERLTLGLCGVAVGLLGGSVLLAACGSDSVEATPAAEVTNLPDLNLDLLAPGIQVEEILWPGHGECIVVAERVNRGDHGTSVAIDVECDLGGG